MLFMSQTLEELLMSRDTIMFLLTQLGFVINLKKSILVPVQQIKFLGLEMKLFLPQRKVKEIFQMSQKRSGRQFDLKRFDKVTGEINFHNSSNFTSETSDSFPAKDTNTDPEKKHELQIYDYSGPEGQKKFGVISERKIHLTDWAPQNFQDSSEWKLSPTVFKQICSHLGETIIGLFVSRLCHQVPRYITWRPDPQSVATDAFQKIGNTDFCMLFHYSQ